MKKSKTDLFIILYPRGRNQWDWEAGRTGVPLIHCSEEGTEESKQNGKRCGVYRRLNTVLSTGWAKGCSLSMCHTHTHTRAHARTHARKHAHSLFFLKATQDVFKKRIHRMIYGAILGGENVSNPTSLLELRLPFHSKGPVQLISGTWTGEGKKKPKKQLITEICE